MLPRTTEWVDIPAAEQKKQYQKPDVSYLVDIKSLSQSTHINLL